MKRILRNPTTRLWCLSGLTGIVLMAGMILEDGQARSYASSPIRASLPVNEQNLHMHSPKTVIFGKSYTFKSGREHPPEYSNSHKLAAVKNSVKTRMGLAILLLGILAEEG